MKKRRLLVLMSPYKTHARIWQMPLYGKTPFLVFIGLFTLFVFVAALLTIGCKEILFRQKIRELTKINRTLKTQLLSYGVVLDTLSWRLQNYQDNLEYYELLVSTGNYNEKSVKEQTIQLADTAGDSTVESLIARANFLQGLASSLQVRQATAGKALQKKIKEIAHLPIMLPVDGRVTSGFGVRRESHQIGGPDRRMHEGVDISMPKGAPIVATADGIVIYAGWSNTYGKLVIINHENGYYTYYAHCSKLKVKVNQRVRRNDIIALVGSTGRSTGPHIHYEVLKKNKPLNSMDLLFLCTWG